LARAYVVRELTCAERQQFLHTATCGSQTPMPNIPAPINQTAPTERD
jgi:hypothetical protein